MSFILSTWPLLIQMDKKASPNTQKTETGGTDHFCLLLLPSWSGPQGWFLCAHRALLLLPMKQSQTDMEDRYEDWVTCTVALLWFKLCYYKSQKMVPKLLTIIWCKHLNYRNNGQWSIHKLQNSLWIPFFFHFFLNANMNLWNWWNFNFHIF